MKVSVVIAAFNAEKTLRRCIEGCLRQTLSPHEIIVVDDGSTDGTRGAVARLIEPTNPTNPTDRSDQSDPSDLSHRSFDPVHSVHLVHYLHQPNAGPAAARNRGAAHATGDIVAFTDSDCIPAPDWLEHLLAGFTDDAVAGVGGTYGIANSESRLARMIHEEIAMRHARMGDEVDFLGSFNVAYRKTAFDAVGGFDETFRTASGEDNDLAYRIIDHGGRLRFTRGAVVAHFHPTRLWRYLRTQYGHGYWRAKLYTKHAGRARGDRYAGLADHVAPSLSIACVAFALLALYTRDDLAAFSIAMLLCVAGFLSYFLLQGWKGVPMARRAGVAAVLAFPALLFVRDLARAFGALHGVWNFMVLRKGLS